MRRRVVVWSAVVVAVLVVTASPASAATVVVSANTTAADFNNAETLADTFVVGSGDSASADAYVGQAKTTGGFNRDDVLTTSAERGWAFTVDRPVNQINATLDSQATGSTAELRTSSGTVIAQKSITDGTVSFTHDFEPGTTYELSNLGTHELVEDINANPATDEGVINYEYGVGGDGSSAFDWETITAVYNDSATYEGQTHTVDDATAVFADVDVTNADVTIEALADTGGGFSVVASQTVSSSGNYSLDVSGVSASEYRVRLSSTTTGSDSVVELQSEGVKFDSDAPTLSNPDPADGANIGDYGGDISVDVSDSDFGTAQGDSVTVEASNQNGVIGSQTVTSNGTVSLSYSPLAGENNITWTAVEADYGEAATPLTQNFSAPDEIVIRNVSNTSQTIDNVDVTIRFYQRASDEVIEKSTSNGRVQMTGLKASEQYLVTARADGYITRKAIVQPLGGQQDIYLLNESRPHAQVVFEVSDPTGEFPPESTFLYVEKPVNKSGNITYQVITADTFGATASYAVDLEAGTRYRLRVVNEDGDERALGYYSATSPATEFLRIQRIEPQANARDDGAVYGAYNASSGALAVRFRGGEPDTTVVYEIRDSAGNVVISETSATGAEFAHVYNLGATPNETVSYTVDYEIQRPDGEDSTGEFTVGNLSGVGDRFDMDPQVLSIASWVGILATMGLVAIVNKSLAPAAGASMASVLTILGTVAIPAPMLGISGAIGVLAIIGGR